MAHRPGILESLRGFGRNGIGLVQNRIELFSVELEEQKLRFIRLLVLTAAAIFLANTALLTVSAAIVILAGEKARVWVLVGLSAIYIAGALWAVMALKKELRSAPPAFENSLSEFRKDTELLSSEE
jgi:uncharacterized membrane protein YqjE